MTLNISSLFTFKNRSKKAHGFVAVTRLRHVLNDKHHIRGQQVSFHLPTIVVFLFCKFTDKNIPKKQKQNKK